MPKVSKTSQSITRSKGNSNAFAVVPEGVYIGVVTELKWEVFNTNSGYQMEKFTPKLRLLNENGTRFDRQDLTIGALNADGEYTNEWFTNPDSSIIFGGYNMDKGNFGARNFMFTAGMLNNNGDVVFNENAIVDLIVRVRVKTRTYTWQGETRHENVVVWWDVPTAEDINTILESDVVTDEWVVYNLCVSEGDENNIAQYSPLVFATQAAFDIWWEIMFTETDEWVHPTGALGEDSDETWFSSWNAWVYDEEIDTPDEDAEPTAVDEIDALIEAVEDTPVGEEAIDAPDTTDDNEVTM